MCCGVLARPSNIWWADRDTEAGLSVGYEETRRRGSQIRCLAQDQPPRKVRILKQDASLFTVYLSVCAEMVQKNSSRKWEKWQRGRIVWAEVCSPPYREDGDGIPVRLWRWRRHVLWFWSFTCSPVRYVQPSLSSYLLCKCKHKAILSVFAISHQINLDFSPNVFISR